MKGLVLCLLSTLAEVIADNRHGYQYDDEDEGEVFFGYSQVVEQNTKEKKYTATKKTEKQRKV